MGLETGIRALLEQRARELEAGAEPVGWKVGINLPEVQAALGIDRPVVGHLTTATVAADGAMIALDGWTRPALEAEIAIRVGDDGRPTALAAAIELVDITLPFDEIEPIMRRNIFHRAVILGEESEDMSVAGLVCRVLKDGSEIAAVEVADEPVAVLAQVGEFLAAYGARLTGGERVIAGAIAAPALAAPGDRFEVDLGRLGALSVSFT